MPPLNEPLPAIKRPVGMENALLATYQVEVSADKADEASLMAMAKKIAIGQTIGTEAAKLDPAMAAVMARPAGVRLVAKFTRHNMQFAVARLTVAFSPGIVQSDLGTMLAVVFGKISMAGKIRLVDLDVPHSLASRYGGPKLGIPGIRQRLGIAEGPLLMGIFKPCLGLSAERLGGMLSEAADAGIQLMKDDEIISDNDFLTARRRLHSCLQAAQGRVLYAINLSGPAEAILDRAKTLVADGAECLLFNTFCYGLPLLNALRDTLPGHVALMAHPALGGAFYGSPMHGIAPSVLFGTFPRLAGADLMLFPSPYGKVSLPKEETTAIVERLVRPNGSLAPVMPVPSAGIQPEMVPDILNDFGKDVIINAGTGIFEHQGGIGAAVHAFRTAIVAATIPRSVPRR